MPVNARLDAETQALLERTAKALRTTKTEVVKKSIRDFCGRVLEERGRKPYELIRDLVGQTESGTGELSMMADEILRERFRRKR